MAIAPGIPNMYVTPTGTDHQMWSKPAGGSTTAASGQTPGNTGDSDYSGNAGLGGASSDDGKDGLVILIW